MSSEYSLLLLITSFYNSFNTSCKRHNYSKRLIKLNYNEISFFSASFGVIHTVVGQVIFSMSSLLTHPPVGNHTPIQASYISPRAYHPLLGSDTHLAFITHTFTISSFVVQIFIKFCQILSNFYQICPKHDFEHFLW